MVTPGDGAKYYPAEAEGLAVSQDAKAGKILALFDGVFVETVALRRTGVRVEFVLTVGLAVSYSTVDGDSKVRGIDSLAFVQEGLR